MFNQEVRYTVLHGLFQVRVPSLIELVLGHHYSIGTTYSIHSVGKE